MRSTSTPANSISVIRADRDKVTALKGIAILLVIGTHFLTSLPEWIYKRESVNFIFVALDQLGRFSVPLFVALSGYGFASKYRTRSAKVLEFIWTQGRKLAPLYIWWCLIFLSVFYFLPWWRAASDLGPWWKQVLLGRADYHLYFIPMVFQLYFLFPFILFIAKKVPSLVLWGVALLFQVGWYWWLGQVIGGEVNKPWFVSDQHQYILSVSWVSYFILGIVLALHPHVLVTLGRPVKKYGVWFLGLLGGILVWRASTLISNGLDPLYALRFTKPSVIPYASMVIAYCVLVRSWWAHLIPVVKRAALFIGKWSFVLYLCHTLVLRILFSTLEQTATFEQLGVASLGLLIGVFGSWYILTRST